MYCASCHVASCHVAIRVCIHRMDAFIYSHPFIDAHTHVWMAHVWMQPLYGSIHLHACNHVDACIVSLYSYMCACYTHRRSEQQQRKRRWWIYKASNKARPSLHCSRYMFSKVMTHLGARQARIWLPWH